MRLGNKNKADQFISVLPVLWSCASHMAYLSREGRRTSDFLFLSENRRFPLINLITKNGGEIGLLRPPIFYCFCPMTWHVASCIWCLPWRTKPSLPSSRGSTWVIYSRKRPLSENRLRTKVGVWMTLLYLKCFGPSPSTGGVILSSRNNMNEWQQAPKRRLFPLTYVNRISPRNGTFWSAISALPSLHMQYQSHTRSCFSI